MDELEIKDKISLIEAFVEDDALIVVQPIKDIVAATLKVTGYENNVCCRHISND